MKKSEDSDAVPQMRLIVTRALVFWILLSLSDGALSTALAQDTVTIPKSRLEELQRKEAELEKMKGDLKTTKGENTELKRLHEQDVLKITSTPRAQPAPTHTSPAMASLPPLSQGEVVDALDLANYYRSDPTAADARFRKRTFRVQGEIAAFEKPLFVRDYRMVLKTADREIRVIADFDPPEIYSAVFTTKHGLELVGMESGRNRVFIAKVGDMVVIEGQCRGLSDLAVKLNGCELKSVRRGN